MPFDCSSSCSLLFYYFYVTSSSLTAPKCTLKYRGRGGSVVEGRIPEREVRIRSLHAPCCVLEQDTLLPENIGYTPEAVAPFQHD